jgi:hypothetical protein
MSFRQIFERVTRIARSGSFDPFEDDFDDELRRAQELIDAEKRREEEAREGRREASGAEGARRGAAGTPGASGAEEEGTEPRSPDIPVEPEIERALLLLGVTSAASLQDITLAYRRRIVEIHPDRHQRGDAGEIDESKLRTQELNRAYALVKEWRTGRG